jgi:hypothetical protein
MTNTTLRARILRAALCAIATAAGAGVARASDLCGTTIPAGSGVVTMAHDHTCAATITVIGPDTTLDMAGKTLTCAIGGPGFAGITLDGAKVVLRNGVVTGCATGVHVDSVKGLVFNVTVKGSSGDGFLVEGVNSRLLDCTAAGNGSDGFRVMSNDNLVKWSTATGNGGSGFVSGTPANWFVENSATDNTLHGFEFSRLSQLRSNQAHGNSAGFRTFADGSVLKRNVATGNVTGFLILDLGSGGSNRLSGNTAAGNITGFEIDAPSNTLRENRSLKNLASGFYVIDDDNLFIGNEAADNTGHGFQMLGTRNTAHVNRSHNNGQMGFDIGGTSNTVKFSYAHNNGEDGIEVSGTGHTLRSNKSLANTGFDMQDTNAACDTNTWLSNIFGTEDVAGGGPNACLQ